MRGAERKHNMAKKKTIEPHTCFECANAYLMRSTPVNPVISECTITKGREVASALFECEYFKLRTTKVVVNPMKYLK